MPRSARSAALLRQADAAVVEEAGEGRPALEHVVDRLGGLGMARQPGAFGAHPVFEIGDERPALSLARRQPVAGRHAVDLALDGEDRVDPPDRLDRQRRLAQIGQLEELAPAMAPARRLGDRPRLAPAVVEIAEPGIGIGLEDPGIAGEMPGGMLAGAIARVEEHRGRRVGPGERPVVAHIGP